MCLLISCVPQSDLAAGYRIRRRGGEALRLKFLSICSHANDEPSDCQTYSSELPPRRWLKEIAVGSAHMIRGCNAGPSAQNHLAGHKLAVVFAECTREVACIPDSRCKGWRSIPNSPQRVGRLHHRSPLRDVACRCRADSRAAAPRSHTDSHSASVGSRQPRQRAKASASKKLMWHTGVSSSAESPCQPLRVKTRQPVSSLASRSQ